jgi:hypothetical protein
MDSDQIEAQLKTALGVSPTRLTFNRGPIHQLPDDFCVFEFAPENGRTAWAYLSCGMSFDEAEPIEIFLLSPRQAPELVELFYAIAHFHLTAERLGEGHTINFGVPWLDHSICDHGFLSTMETNFEWLQQGEERVHYLWLIPITKAERDYKIAHGIEALDAKLDEHDVDCTDPLRKSSV